MSEPLPNDTTFEKRTPRSLSPVTMSPAFAPDCEITNTSPGSRGKRSSKEMRSSGTYSPRQFGPSTRTPPARARSASSRSVSAMPASSVSENPAV